MAGNQGEKTEQPTYRRKQKARLKGQIAKSQELKTAMMTLVAILAIKYMAPGLKERLTDMFISSLGTVATIPVDITTTPLILAHWIKWSAVLLGPLFATLVFTGVAVNMLTQGGFLFSTQAIRFDLSSINPINGVGRMFGGRIFFKLLVDVVKVIMIGFVCWGVMKSSTAMFINQADIGIADLLSSVGATVVDLFMKATLILFVLGVADFAFQRKKHTKDLKMTKQETKDEHKESEGDPLIKSRIRAAQRELLRRRMMQNVPDADVVLTNPTHIAVALKYDPTGMNAPIVVAKGERLIAERIKQIARDAGVPVIEDKPLARAIFKMTKIGEQIPADLYRAVAEVLSYVYKLKGKKIPAASGV